MNPPIGITAAAKELGVSRQTIHYHVRVGNLPVFEVGDILAIRHDIWQDFKRSYQAGGFPVGRPARAYLPKWRLRHQEVAK